MTAQRIFIPRGVTVTLQIVSLSLFVGMAIAVSRDTGGALLFNMAIGATGGFFISLPITLLELQFFSNLRRRKNRRLRPVFLILMRGAAYSAVIVAALIVQGVIFGLGPVWEDDDFVEVFLISAVISFLFAFGLEIIRLLGREATIALITGRYVEPRLEDRVIMFVDVAGSTALAERIGQLNFHTYLRDVAQDLAIAVDVFGGDVHKYVGDAVIVTWPFAKGVRDAACLSCATQMHEIVQERADHYTTTYGAPVRLRIAIHCGEVAAGEIGDWKKEIALLGDPMNTVARIEGAAKALGRKTVLSDPLVAALEGGASDGLERLPDYAAAGKQEKLVLWGVSA